MSDARLRRCRKEIMGKSGLSIRNDRDACVDQILASVGGSCLDCQKDKVSGITIESEFISPDVLAAGTDDHTYAHYLDYVWSAVDGSPTHLLGSFKGPVRLIISSITPRLLLNPLCPGNWFVAHHSTFPRPCVFSGKLSLRGR